MRLTSNTWPVAKKFFDMGVEEVEDRKQLVFTLDHDVQNKSDANKKKYQQIEEFAAKQGVSNTTDGYSLIRLVHELRYCFKKKSRSLHS